MSYRSLCTTLAIGLFAFPIDNARAAYFCVGGAGSTHSDIEAALQAASAGR